MSCLVTALFYDSDNLKTAIDALIAQGVPLSDLSLMLGRSTAGKYFAPDEESVEVDGPLAGWRRISSRPPATPPFQRPGP